MIDNLHDIQKLHYEGRNASVHTFDKYQLGLGEHYPAISVFTETLPQGLISDEI
jgi:hypothetical protein